MEIKIMEKLRKSMDNDDDILELLIDLSEEKQHNQLWIITVNILRILRVSPKLQASKKLLKENNLDLTLKNPQVRLLLKYGSEKMGSLFYRCSILLGFIKSKNLRGLWIYLLMKVQNATSLVFFDIIKPRRMEHLQS